VDHLDHPYLTLHEIKNNLWSFIW